MPDLNRREKHAGIISPLVTSSGFKQFPGLIVVHLPNPLLWRFPLPARFACSDQPILLVISLHTPRPVKDRIVRVDTRFRQSSVRAGGVVYFFYFFKVYPRSSR